MDPSGRYLDLTKDDLEVVEDGVPQAVETFQEAVQPVSIVLALDASGSMKRKEADVVASASEFVDALQERDKLALLMFGDKATFAHDLSTNREFSRDAIKDYRAIGGTALYDALSESLLRIKYADGRRVVVVMTDGRDENNAGTAAGSTRRFEDVLKYIKDSGAMVFAIGLGTNVDHDVLQKIADVSGGRAFFPTDVSQLSADTGRSWTTCAGATCSASHRRTFSATAAGGRLRSGSKGSHRRRFARSAGISRRRSRAGTIHGREKDRRGGRFVVSVGEKDKGAHADIWRRRS